MKRKTLLVDASSDAILLNRYIAFSTFRKYNTQSKKKNHLVVYQKESYVIQWQNIWADLKAAFNNPVRIAPQIAYSLLAFWFIFQGKQVDAYMMAFGGALAYDAASQSNASGEPASISWSHTTGAGSDRLGVLFAGGLNNPNLGTWGGNATTEIITEPPARSSYYLAPSSGSTTLAITGGNIKVGGAISFSGADQTDPIGATTSESDTFSPNDMTLTTEANGSIRIDAVVANNGNSNNTTGVLDSGTLRFNPVTPQNQFRCGYFGYTNAQATAGSDTHQWTLTNDNETRKYLAIEIKAATGGGGGGGDTTPHWPILTGSQFWGPR